MIKNLPRIEMCNSTWRKYDSYTSSVSLFGVGLVLHLLILGMEEFAMTHFLCIENLFIYFFEKNR